MILLDDFDTVNEPGVSTDVPGVFVFFVVIMVVLAVGSFFWRISTARDMATRAGLDPDEAATMAAFTDNGLEATYLASNLRPSPPSPPAPGPAGRSAAERLAELSALRDSGAISEAEYADRRRAIIDSV